MALKAASTINLKRERHVRYVAASGRSQLGIIRAITGGGTTLTLFLPSERRVVTGVAKATTVRGVGFHHRAAV